MKKVYTLMATLFLWSAFTYAQNGDSCSVAVEITTNGDYTVEAITGTGAVGGTATAAAWFYYTATADGVINVSSCAGAGGEDTRLYIYDGTCVALNQVGFDDDGCLSPETFASVIQGQEVISGTTYYIEWTDQYDSGTFVFNFEFEVPVYNEGDNCGLPIVVDFSTDLPYADLAQTNCGRGDTYDATCMGLYDNGEDIIYMLELDADYTVEFKLDPNGTTYAGIGVFDSCPDADNCVSILTWGGGSDVDSMEVILTAGTYYFMVDTWSSPDCIPVFDLDITAVEISCLPISGVVASAVTASEVTFNWNAEGNTDFDYAVDTTGFDIGAATILTTTDTFATAMGLEAEATYDIYVRANCGVDNYSDWMMITFNTPCAAPSVQTLPYFEDFEGVSTPDLPCGGWVITNNDETTNTWVSYFGQALALTYESATASDDLAQTPELALTGGVSYTLVFDLRAQSTFYNESMAVIYYDSNGAIDTLLNFPTIDYSVYEVKTVDFTPAADGNYRIGFYGYSAANAWRVLVDNILVAVTPECAPPLVLDIMDVTDVSASAHWSNVGSDYEIAYDLTGFDIGAAIPVAVTDTMSAMTGLTTLTTYDVYVRQSCLGEGIFSAWNMSTFTTNGTPPANDLICDATVVALGDTTVVDNTWATWGGDSATCWGNYNNGDVWLEFTFTPTAELNGVEIVTEEGTSNDSHIALYSSDGDCSGNLTQLGCDEDGGATWMSYIGPTSLEAGTYYVQGATWTGSEGDWGIAIHPVFVPNPPANDDCDGATVTAVVIDGATASNTGDGTGATDTFGLGLNQVWEAFTIDDCANVTLDFCGSAQTSTALFNVLYDTCPQGASVQTATISGVDDCGDGNGSIAASWIELPAGTYYYPVIVDVATYGGYEAYTINFTATSCGAVSDTCDTFLGGPWTDFNGTFGGAPVADENGDCPINEITTFQIWASESYTVDGFTSGEEYTFSMCNGYGAWDAELTVWDENGDLVAMEEGCSITWTAAYDGTYVIGINEVGACGAASGNTSTDNGFPSLTCDGTVGVNELEQADFAIYPNPNNGEFSIVNEGVNGEYLIELIDVTGKVVYSEQLQLNANEKTVINSTDVNTGIYLVKMTNTEANYYRTLRMVIK